jgi:hypothetical protein
MTALLNVLERTEDWRIVFRLMPSRLVSVQAA